MESTRDLAEAMEQDFGPAWRQGAPLGAEEVERFEQEHKIRLPEPYRDFVINVANGAVGPAHYGLVALGAPSSNGPGHSISRGSLAKPFPLVESWLWEGSEDINDVDVLERIEEVHTVGGLPLGTDGCGMDYALIVTGEARGQVWMLSGEFALPVATDFGAWLRGELLPDAEWLLENRPRPPAADQR